MSETKILIVGENKLYLRALADTLETYQHQVIMVADGHVALSALEKQAVDLVICEEGMSQMNGREFLHLANSKQPDLPVVLLADFGTVERAVQAMREGAADYLVKPIDTDLLLELVARLTKKNRNEDDSSNNTVVAKDPYSIELLQLARKVATNDVSVLISGESGTGKEVLARYIHQHSARKDGPFVAINCAAIPENMLEAVLFGHEKGAFTGAIQANIGKFELAQGGTLLLDEISEMELGLQAKLLRVLQEREVERLGSNTTVALDVRVLATTNRKLADVVQEGNFREDLYYRLNVFPLSLMPLRDRPADIEPLAEKLIQRHTGIGEHIPALSEVSKQLLEDYTWPGNIRELGNVLQRALVLCDGYEITPADLRFESMTSNTRTIQVAGSRSSTLTNNVRSHEYELILKALETGNGSRKKAAEQLKISPRTLRYKLAKMRDEGIEIPAS